MRLGSVVGEDLALALTVHSTRSVTTLIPVGVSRVKVAHQGHVSKTSELGPIAKLCVPVQHPGTASLRTQLESVVGADRACAQMVQSTRSVTTLILVEVLRVKVAHQEHVSQASELGRIVKLFVRRLFRREDASCSA